MKKIYLVLLMTMFSLLIFAQEEEFIGAGQNEGIRVTTSSNFFSTDGARTLDGSGLDAKSMEVSRFLSQATIGYEEKHIENVLELGIENWIDIQQLVPPQYMLPTHDAIFEEAKAVYDENKDRDAAEYFGPWGLHFNYAWWQTNLTNEDLLRHKVALALSQILVISMNSDSVSYTHLTLPTKA